jgi:hypothetical protein
MSDIIDNPITIRFANLPELCNFDGIFSVIGGIQV